MSRRYRPGRYFAQRDKNEGPIVETLQARGFYVTQVSGTGVPDLLVSKDGAMWLVEVKQPNGTYKPAQVTFRERWTGPPPITLRSIEDAIRFPQGPEVHA
jgi:Holliday junction resolvase